jgi:hypothetical protein
MPAGILEAAAIAAASHFVQTLPPASPNLMKSPQKADGVDRLSATEFTMPHRRIIVADGMGA